MSLSGPMVAVIGGGPAGLMAAEAAAASGARVTLFERMASPGRKFLLAGRGGLNLTHSEPPDVFLSRYGDAAVRLSPLLEAFSPAMLRDWALQLGQSTFVGSSGRVFPQSFKSSPLLRAWLRRLLARGVDFRLRHTFQGWDADRLIFAAPGGDISIEADATVLAMGGASWPRLGSDGGWAGPLGSMGVEIAPLRPSNCGFDIGWTDFFATKFAGTPLKPIALTFAGTTVRGECVITRHGLEGGAIYALSAPLREEIARSGAAHIRLDLRPDVATDELARRVSAPRSKQSGATFLRKAAGLTPAAIALLREAGPLPEEPDLLAARMKALPLRLDAPRPLERAISTAGGVRFDEIDASLMVKKRPGLFVAGEMLDWEAPTGGYLLQACFATGFVAGTAAARAGVSRPI